MFVLSRHVDSVYRVIATLVTASLILCAFSLHSLTAHAANVTNVYDLLSDSAPSVGSNHEIQFVTPAGPGVTTGETIDLTFPAGFDISSITDGDIDIAANGSDLTQTTDWSSSVSSQTLTITLAGTASIAAGATTTIKIGTNATVDAAGTNQITNPSTGSYEIDISAGASDSGHTRVAIVDTVLVTANVSTSFDFTVNGVATSTAINGTTTTNYSSSTTIPFGNLTAGNTKIIGQNLTVQTNARNGFVVTVEDDGPFQSSTGADIDMFKDGTLSGTPAAWAAPSNDINDENQWGHWGVTSDDGTTTRANQFTSDTWVGVTTTPTILFSHDGSADGTTPGIGSANVAYAAEITPLQEAGDDYSTVLTYIATPTF